MMYSVKYYYLVTGMEGRADEQDYGFVSAQSAAEAKEIVADGLIRSGSLSRANRSWFIGCLRANPADGGYFNG